MVLYTIYEQVKIDNYSEKYDVLRNNHRSNPIITINEYNFMNYTLYTYDISIDQTRYTEFHQSISYFIPVYQKQE